MCVCCTPTITIADHPLSTSLVVALDRIRCDVCIGHDQILYGNVAPGGAVAKITGKEGLTFSGVAKVCACVKGEERGRRTAWDEK